MDSWCGNCYCTICGEKIYIEDVRKPSKIDGFGDLTIAYEKSEEGRENSLLFFYREKYGLRRNLKFHIK